MIRPRPGEGVTWVKGSYQSMYGTIVCDWKIEEGQFILNLTVPPNTSATIYLPATEISTVFENGQPVTQSADIQFNRIEDKYVVLDITSGIYSFATKFK